MGCCDGKEPDRTAGGFVARPDTGTEPEPVFAVLRGRRDYTRGEPIRTRRLRALDYDPPSPTGRALDWFIRDLPLVALTDARINAAADWLAAALARRQAVQLKVKAGLEQLGART